MRAFLASSIGVTCAAALVLPSAVPAGAAADSAPVEPVEPAGVPGSTQSLAIGPLADPSDPATDDPTRTAGAAGQGLTERAVRPFSLVGVVWDDPDAELQGTVQVRTRARDTGDWSDWQDLETHNAEHAADPGSTERGSGGVRGSTAPLWVGDSDGVAVRVRPGAADSHRHGHADDARDVDDAHDVHDARDVDDAHDAREAVGARDSYGSRVSDGSRASDGSQGRAVPAASLPAGLRLELVDPGQDARQTLVETGRRTEGTGTTGSARTTGNVGSTGSTGTTRGTGTTGRVEDSDFVDSPDSPDPLGFPGSPDLTDVIGLADLTDSVVAAAGAQTAASTGAIEAVRDAWGIWGAGDGLTPPLTSPLDAASPDATALPALDKAETEARSEAEPGSAPGAQPYIGPRPRIITRKGWGADEKLRERAFVYTKTVKAAFIHHSATGNNYTCSQAPAVLRGIYRYHVKSNGWRDFGYNFAVDKCGNIYEGRAGGVTKAVLGAHTLGFNDNSMGIAVLGTFSESNPSAAAVNAVAKLTAWKLGQFGADPSGRTTLVSGGGNKFKKGTKVRLNVISGHRDGFATECPGARLYKQLGSARTSSARLQGR
ncbi:N-acetylmuramoyl-L-alanine amidase [Streptomyces sp. NPDC047985]|uniref:peptidoglycan recognition protein family protein n=1 Tax=unclassified Streptomyces TaxID=2593676 RepID=UPI00341373C4